VVASVADVFNQASVRSVSGVRAPPPRPDAQEQILAHALTVLAETISMWDEEEKQNHDAILSGADTLNQWMHASHARASALLG
jgi:hypothetical protein